MIQEKYPESFSRTTSMGGFKAIAIARADHVICISENTRRDLVELLKIPERKTSVVYLGYDLATHQVAESPLRPKSFILYVGKRGGYKNFMGLLRAYAASLTLKGNFSLVCFGGGLFSLEERKQISALGLRPDRVVQLSGRDDVLAGLYSAAVALIYPSKYEGFGIPPLEAMSFGCPVVCSNTSSLPEVVGEAAELFDPEDEMGLRTAIERVVSSPQRAQALVQSGYERIKRFSWSKCARDTLHVYDKVLNG
jgi:glycosyltransferase involved in cell wall biosynthesis